MPQMGLQTTENEVSGEALFVSLCFLVWEERDNVASCLQALSCAILASMDHLPLNS